MTQDKEREALLQKACTLIDRMRTRVMMKMDEQVTSKEIDTFFNEVGYVPEIVRTAHAARDRAIQNRQETAVSNVQKVQAPLADNNRGS